MGGRSETEHFVIYVTALSLHNRFLSFEARNTTVYRFLVEITTNLGDICRNR